MKTYHSKDIQRLARVTKMQLGHWVNVGAIIPLKDDPRRGGVRIFSQQNLVEAMICRELNYWRMEARSIAGPLWALRKMKFWERLAEEPDYLETRVFVFVRAKNVKNALQKLRSTGALSELDEVFPVAGGVEAIEKVLGDMSPGELERELFGIESSWGKPLLKLIDFFSSCMVVDLKKLVEEAGGL